MNHPMKISGKIAILGGGAWGTAIAAMLARTGHQPALYVRDPEIANIIKKNHQNPAYLPEITLPHNLSVTSNPQEALENANLILSAIPVQAFSTALSSMTKFIEPTIPFILSSKGIDHKSGRFLSEISEELLPQNPVALLSGPSFAMDVARCLPVAVTIAAKHKYLAQNLAFTLSGPLFRCYASDDIKGVEIGGAFKNILALAAGMAAGQQLGASAQAALITRGFAEIRRIAVTLGGKQETLSGLSVLGDLILSCSSPQSRNYSYGFALSLGQKTKDLPLSEGVATAPVAAALCLKHQIEAPIVQNIADILNQKVEIKEAIHHLITRPLKFED